MKSCSFSDLIPPARLYHALFCLPETYNVEAIGLSPGIRDDFISIFVHPEVTYEVSVSTFPQLVPDGAGVTSELLQVLVLGPT